MPIKVHNSKCSCQAGKDRAETEKIERQSNCRVRLGLDLALPHDCIGHASKTLNEASKNMRKADLCR